MTDDLPLSRMFRPIPRIEQSPPNTNKRIIKLGLQEPIAVPVNLWNSLIIRNRDMVRCDPDECAVLLVLRVDDLVAVSVSCLTGEPEFGEGGWEGSWVFAEAVGVEDEWDDD